MGDNIMLLCLLTGHNHIYKKALEQMGKTSVNMYTEASN